MFKCWERKRGQHQGYDHFRGHLGEVIMEKVNKKDPQNLCGWKDHKRGIPPRLSLLYVECWGWKDNETLCETKKLKTLPLLEITFKFLFIIHSILSKSYPKN